MSTNSAYMAGLIDGEGSIMLTRNSSNQNRTPTISMTSTTYEMVAWLKETYGGSISTHKTYQDHHKTSYSWKLTGNQVFPVIEAILPYMREPVKRSRAELLLNEYASVTIRNGKYSEMQKTKKLEFESKFLALC